MGGGGGGTILEPVSGSRQSVFPGRGVPMFSRRAKAVIYCVVVQ